MHFGAPGSLDGELLEGESLEVLAVWNTELLDAPAGSTAFSRNAPAPSAVMTLIAAMTFFMSRTVSLIC
jgi:hypothetical protein